MQPSRKAHQEPPSAAPGHLVFESLLAELSARVLTLPTSEIDQAITDALRRVAELLQVDRTQLIRFDPRRRGLHVTHSGAVHGIAEGAPSTALAKAFPWAVARLRRGELTQYASLDELPPEAATDRQVWQRYGVKSELIVPLFVDGEVDGAMVLDCDRAERHWTPETVARMQALTTIVGNALAHKRSREALDAAMRFEHIASDVLARLLAAPQGEHDAVLEAGLGEVARAFGAQRATLWQRGDGDAATFRKAHRWLADGSGALADAADLPWMSARLIEGQVLRFSSLAGLPAAAASDLDALRRLGIGSAVVVPLQRSGRVTGALSIGTVLEGTDWPEELVPRLQLLGNAFDSFVARRVSEQREHEAQAQAVHAARVGSMGVFAASMVHELTQPLAASLANAETAAELLQPARPDLSGVRETVADIVADSRRAGELIQKLRRFLRHGEAERAQLEAASLLADVTGFVANICAAKGIELVVEPPRAACRFVGDRVQLQQVLLNLLLNAFDAVADRPPQTRQVRLRGQADEDRLVFEVSDNGGGMDDATLARVFQPFFTTKAGGMGLGLSICQTIVASHGGTIGVSATPGQGSCFRVSLPLRAPRVAPARPLATNAAHPGDTVFVIDDDEAMRRALERQLTGEGYRVESFANAHDFLDRLPRCEVACILSDLRMPGLSGLDLQATLVRAGNPWPMVFISGHADVPTSVQLMKSGAVALLPKPFAKAELLAAVADALARSRRRQAERQRGAELRGRLAQLSAREHEVFDLVTGGLPNKLVARQLGIAESTVKIHRGRVMDKLGAATVADLMRIKQALTAGSG